MKLLGTVLNAITPPPLDTYLPEGIPTKSITTRLFVQGTCDTGKVAFFVLLDCMLIYKCNCEGAIITAITAILNKKMGRLWKLCCRKASKIFLIFGQDYLLKTQ